MSRSLVAILLFLVVIGCNTTTGTQSPTSATEKGTMNEVAQEVPAEITVQDLHKLLVNQNDNRVLLDVRTPEEVAQGVIAGAVIIDYRGAGFEDQLKSLDPSKHYIIYCRSGGRSGRTQEMMEALGFQQVTNVLGGMNDWKVAGYPVATMK